MEEWFYVKNDLKAREDIKEVIMRPIWSRFGLRRPKVKIDEVAEVCQKSFWYCLLFYWYKRFNPGAYNLQSMATCGELGNAEGDCHQVWRR